MMGVQNEQRTQAREASQAFQRERWGQTDARYDRQFDAQQARYAAQDEAAQARADALVTAREDRQKHALKMQTIREIASADLRNASSAAQMASSNSRFYKSLLDNGRLKFTPESEREFRKSQNTLRTIAGNPNMSMAQKIRATDIEREKMYGYETEAADDAAQPRQHPGDPDKMLYPDPATGKEIVGLSQEAREREAAAKAKKEEDARVRPINTQIAALETRDRAAKLRQVKRRAKRKAFDLANMKKNESERLTKEEIDGLFSEENEFDEEERAGIELELKELRGQLAPVAPTQPAPTPPPGKIRVRHKTTGKVGLIPADKFDPKEWERVE